MGATPTLFHSKRAVIELRDIAKRPGRDAHTGDGDGPARRRSRLRTRGIGLKRFGDWRAPVRTSIRRPRRSLMSGLDQTDRHSKDHRQYNGSQ